MDIAGKQNNMEPMETQRAPETSLAPGIQGTPAISRATGITWTLGMPIISGAPGTWIPGMAPGMPIRSGTTGITWIPSITPGMPRTPPRMPGIPPGVPIPAISWIPPVPQVPGESRVPAIPLIKKVSDITKLTRGPWKDPVSGLVSADKSVFTTGAGVACGALSPTDTSETSSDFVQTCLGKRPASIRDKSQSDDREPVSGPASKKVKDSAPDVLKGLHDSGIKIEGYDEKDSTIRDQNQTEIELSDTEISRLLKAYEHLQAPVGARLNKTEKALLANGKVEYWELAEVKGEEWKKIRDKTNEDGTYVFANKAEKREQSQVQLLHENARKSKANKIQAWQKKVTQCLSKAAERHFQKKGVRVAALSPAADTERACSSPVQTLSGKSKAVMVCEDQNNGRELICSPRVDFEPHLDESVSEPGSKKEKFSAEDALGFLHEFGFKINGYDEKMRTIHNLRGRKVELSAQEVVDLGNICASLHTEICSDLTTEENEIRGKADMGLLELGRLKNESWTRKRDEKGKDGAPVFSSEEREVLMRLHRKAQRNINIRRSRWKGRVQNILLAAERRMMEKEQAQAQEKPEVSRLPIPSPRTSPEIPPEKVWQPF